ncbi:helix-turn-helix domain-containing protein [Actinomyces qiguomingii]|uniref:helix-turn-helix domain-containing protein n=1 Tax=Actinomyces qiguomingii TaxID=2057800 RepID=UPI000CA01139|nr:helix-turn-helix domain-containing protein [Actinomyces qiguomingii]
MNQSLTVMATRWSGGWELELDDDHHTQVTHLDRARQQVVDYLDTVDETTDHSSWKIDIVPEVDSLAQVRAAKETAARAKALQEEATAAWREAALALRAEGLSVSDTAAIMGISRGRVSQLTATG